MLGESAGEPPIMGDLPKPRPRVGCGPHRRRPRLYLAPDGEIGRVMKARKPRPGLTEVRDHALHGAWLLLVLGRVGVADALHVDLPSRDHEWMWPNRRKTSGSDPPTSVSPAGLYEVPEFHRCPRSPLHRHPRMGCRSGEIGRVMKPGCQVKPGLAEVRDQDLHRGIAAPGTWACRYR